MAQSVIETCEICYQDVGNDYCKNCEQTFCDNCKIMHLRMKSSYNHKFHSSQCEGQEAQWSCCDKHNSDYIYLCEKCDVPACRHCTVYTHKGHPLASLSSSIAEKTENLLKVLKANYNDIHEAQNLTLKLQSKIADLQENCIVIHSDVSERSRQLQSKLLKAFSIQRDHIFRHKKVEETKVQTFIGNVNECNRKIEELTELHKQVKNERDITHLVQSLKSLEQKIMSIQIPKAPVISNMKLVTEPMDEEVDAKLKSLLGTITVASMYF